MRLGEWFMKLGPREPTDEVARSVRAAPPLLEGALRGRVQPLLGSNRPISDPAPGGYACAQQWGVGSDLRGWT